MKKTILLSLGILWSACSAFAQDESQVDLREKSMRFLVNSMPMFAQKGDNIIPSFRKNHNKGVFYWFNNKDLDLNNQLFGMQKANPEWRDNGNGLFFVNRNFDGRYKVSFLADSTAADQVQPYDLKVSVFNTQYDAEYAYVVLRFKSAGSMEPFYTGEVVCKYDRKGNLVKYSYLEQ